MDKAILFQLVRLLNKFNSELFKLIQQSNEDKELIDIYNKVADANNQLFDFYDNLKEEK